MAHHITQYGSSHYTMWLITTTQYGSSHYTMWLITLHNMTHHTTQYGSLRYTMWLITLHNGTHHTTQWDSSHDTPWLITLSCFIALYIMIHHTAHDDSSPYMSWLQTCGVWNTEIQMEGKDPLYDSMGISWWQWQQQIKLLWSVSLVPLSFRQPPPFQLTQDKLN